MNAPSDSIGSISSPAVSRNLPGPPCLRNYPAHQLVTWQPQGTLDDLLLDQIAEWLVGIEKASLPFKRFVDLSQLTAIAVRTRYLSDFARKRAEEFAGAEPIRAALFSDDWIGFGIARVYETLMENTKIHVRAFRERAPAAEWLGVPADILTLEDDPAAQIENRPREKS